jgi:hypothetical protein
VRWLFLLLVILNVTYVAWELNRERPQQMRKAAPPKGVEPIILLSELNEKSSQSPENVTAAAGSKDLAASRNPAGDQPPAEQAEAVQSGLQTASLNAEPPPSDTDPQPEGPLPAEQPSAPSPSAEPAADLCYTLGPFREMKTLRVVTREIRDYVVEASFRSKEEQEQTMFRVLVRALDSKQEAQAMIRELNKKNIRDHFIITEGPNRNAISLGYFSSKSRAYRHADRVQKLGFDAYAEPVFRSYTIYWLDYRIEAGREIPQQIFDEHLQSSGQRLSRACT